MTTLHEAAQQALEYLDAPSAKLWPAGTQHRIITALRAALAEPVQEPVAWLTPRTVDSYMRPDLGYETCSKTDYAAFPVYTAPPQRKPLTEEEIDALAMDEDGLPNSHLEFARIIERAHGIGGQDES